MKLFTKIFIFVFAILSVSLLSSGPTHARDQMKVYSGSNYSPNHGSAYGDINFDNLISLSEKNYSPFAPSQNASLLYSNPENRIPQSVRKPKYQRPKSHHHNKAHNNHHKMKWYTVQFGSYRSEEEALERKIDLEKIQMRAKIIKANLGHRGIWYRVHVGKFYSKANAKSFLAKNKNKKVGDHFILKLNPHDRAVANSKGH